MDSAAIETRHWVLLVFIVSALYAHLRGTVRFGLVRALTDFTVLIAPVNALMYLFSRTRRSAYIDQADFPELEPLRVHWQEIRDEAMALAGSGQIRAASGYNDVGFNSFFRTGWKRFYLTWYGKELPSAQEQCPKTMALLKQIPTIKAAMFASLPPGATLVRHRDPYAGSLRYHLGLTTPNDPGFSARQWNMQQLDMPRAWDLEPGASSSIIVAVVDGAIRDMYKRHAYVISDASLQAPPEIWAKVLANEAQRWSNAPIIAGRPTATSRTMRS